MGIVIVVPNQSGHKQGRGSYEDLMHDQIQIKGGES